MMDTGDLYAYIELKDFEWVVTSADGQGKTTAPSVTTKLIMGAFSIKTFSKPTVKVDYVDPVDGGRQATDDKEDEFPGVDFDDVGTLYDWYGIDRSVRHRSRRAELGGGFRERLDRDRSRRPESSRTWWIATPTATIPAPR